MSLIGLSLISNTTMPEEQLEQSELEHAKKLLAAHEQQLKAKMAAAAKAWTEATDKILAEYECVIRSVVYINGAPVTISNSEIKFEVAPKGLD
jgi:hypothetical protein